mgnify:CR=1 FL=1
MRRFEIPQAFDAAGEPQPKVDHKLCNYLFGGLIQLEIKARKIQFRLDFHRLSLRDLSSSSSREASREWNTSDQDGGLQPLIFSY